MVTVHDNEPQGRRAAGSVAGSRGVATPHASALGWPGEARPPRGVRWRRSGATLPATTRCRPLPLPLPATHTRDHGADACGGARRQGGAGACGRRGAADHPALRAAGGRHAAAAPADERFVTPGHFALRFLVFFRCALAAATPAEPPRGHGSRPRRAGCAAGPLLGGGRGRDRVCARPGGRGGPPNQARQGRSGGAGAGGGPGAAARARQQVRRRRGRGGGCASCACARGPACLPACHPPVRRGARLLAAMGYKPGQGLGREGQGRAEPVPLHLKQVRGWVAGGGR